MNLQLEAQLTLQVNILALIQTLFYPPELLFRWNDYIDQSSGSSTTNITGSTNNFYVSLRENKPTYDQNSINKFIINVRPNLPYKDISNSI